MRAHPILLASVVLAAGLLCQSAFGDVSPAPEHSGASDVKALIAQLGDAKFAARKSAGDKLARIGLPAYQALEDATRDGDREIRYRAEKILSVIRQNDLNRRLTIFLASLESPEDRTLPSWPRFKAAHGNTTLTRMLFVEMQRAEGELLAQLDADPRHATEILGKRAIVLAQDQDRTNREGLPLQMSLGQIAAVYFVATEPDIKPSSYTIAMLLRLGTQPAIQASVVRGATSDKQAAEKGAVARKLLGGVIARAEDSAAQQGVHLAVVYDLKEGLAPALKILGAPGRSRITVQNAMLLVAKYGEPAHLAALEKLFTDHTVVATPTNNRVRREIQLRDSALAAAVLMTKQELKDYFVVPENLTQPGTASSSYLMIGFDNDELRTEAFRKWDAFKAKMQPAEPKK